MGNPDLAVIINNQYCFVINGFSYENKPEAIEQAIKSYNNCIHAAINEYEDAPAEALLKDKQLLIAETQALLDDIRDVKTYEVGLMR